MQKLSKVVFTWLVLSLSIVAAAGASAQESSGCKTGKFVGSYTTPDPRTDAWGDGTGVAHTYLLQLNLHSDGIATQEPTGAPDLMLSGGSVTPFVGSWKCRRDGKLVVTMLDAVYGTTTDAINHPASVPNPPPVDVFLIANHRFTYLFTVTDENTLTRVQFRKRVYQASEDPSDPNGGTLRPLVTTEVIYKRLVASDADLLLP